MAVETNTRKITARLEREGWVNVGGGKHDKFTHPDRRGEVIIIPCHTVQRIGTARSIAKAAGWI